MCKVMMMNDIGEKITNQQKTRQLLCKIYQTAGREYDYIGLQ